MGSCQTAHILFLSSCLYLCIALPSRCLATLLLLPFLAVKDLSASLLLWQIKSIPGTSQPLLNLLSPALSLFTRRGYHID